LTTTTMIMTIMVILIIMINHKCYFVVENELKKRNVQDNNAKKEKNYILERNNTEEDNILRWSSKFHLDFWELRAFDALPPLLPPPLLFAAHRASSHSQAKHTGPPARPSAQIVTVGLEELLLIWPPLGGTQLLFAWPAQVTTKMTSSAHRRRWTAAAFRVAQRSLGPRFLSWANAITKPLHVHTTT